MASSSLDFSCSSRQNMLNTSFHSSESLWVAFTRWLGFSPASKPSDTSSNSSASTRKETRCTVDSPSLIRSWIFVRLEHCGQQCPWDLVLKPLNQCFIRLSYWKALFEWPLWLLARLRSICGGIHEYWPILIRPRLGVPLALLRASRFSNSTLNLACMESWRDVQNLLNANVC